MSFILNDDEQAILDNLHNFIDPLFQVVVAEGKKAMIALKTNPQLCCKLLGIDHGTRSAHIPSLHDVLVYILSQRISSSFSDNSKYIADLETICSFINPHLSALKERQIQFCDCERKIKLGNANIEHSLTNILTYVLHGLNENIVLLIVKQWKKSFPFLFSSNKKPALTFWSRLCGGKVDKKFLDMSETNLSVADLHFRLGWIEEKLMNSQQRRLLTEYSFLWITTDLPSQKMKLLEISSTFPPYFENHLKTIKEDSPLDFILEEVMRTQTYLQRPTIENKEPPLFPGLSFRTHQVYDSGSNILLGTVFAIDNVLSSSFLENFISTTSNPLKFVREMRSSN